MNRILSDMRFSDYLLLLVFSLGMSLFALAAMALTPVGWVVGAYHRIKYPRPS